MKWLLVSPGQEGLVRVSLSAAATGLGYPMKLSALLLSSNGLKPKATESPRARYSCGRLEAARALGTAGPASRIVASVARRATAAINQRMRVCSMKILPCSVHADAHY